MTIFVRCVVFCAATAVSGHDPAFAEDEPHEPAKPEASAGTTSNEFPNTIYRYRNKRGRHVFTNIWDDIPASHRARAEKVDLSHITLNPQIGAELDASMQQEFEVMSASPECREVKEQAQHWLKPVWDDYGHLIVLGAVMFALLLATPFALRRVDAPVWARTLTKSIMLLGFVGLFMHTTVSAGKTYKAMQSAAEPCERETWTGLSNQKNERSSKLKLLMDLQSMIRHAQTQTDQDRLDELDKLLK